MEQNRYDFFLSYSRDVSTITEYLANELEKFGLKVWVDRTDVILGRDIYYNLDKVLIHCMQWSGVILLLNEAYFNKDWCIKELDFFLEYNIPIVPIYYYLEKENIPEKYCILNRYNRVSIKCDFDLEIAIKKILSFYISRITITEVITVVHTNIWENLIHNRNFADPNSANTLIATDNIAMFLQHCVKGKQITNSYIPTLINIIHRILLRFYQTGEYDIYDQKNTYWAITKLIKQVECLNEYSL